MKTSYNTPKDWNIISWQTTPRVVRRKPYFCLCAVKTYSLIRNLTAPAKPGKEIVDIVKQHCNPQPSEIVQRYLFHTHRRKPTESVNEYVAKLRKLSEFCNFGILLMTD